MCEDIKFKCPVCGGNIEFHIHTDNHEYIEIDVNGDVIERIDGATFGGTDYYCKKNKEHDLGRELLDALFKQLDLVE